MTKSIILSVTECNFVRVTVYGRQLTEHTIILSVSFLLSLLRLSVPLPRPPQLRHFEFEADIPALRQRPRHSILFILLLRIIRDPPGSR